MLTDFDQKIIPNYSPISARGGSKGRRSRKLSTRSRKLSRSRKLRKSNTRRRYR